MRIERRHNSSCDVIGDVYYYNHVYPNTHQQARGNTLLPRDTAQHNIFDSRCDYFKIDTLQASAETRNLR